MFAPSLVRNFPYVQLLDPSVALSEISIATEMIKWYDYLFLGASPSLAKEDKAWQRDRKRKTMALFATAEVPDKFLLLDNRHVASVSTTAETPDPDSEITEHADPSSSSSSSPPPPPPSPRGAPATTAPSPSGPLLTLPISPRPAHTNTDVPASPRLKLDLRGLGPTATSTSGPAHKSPAASHAGVGLQRKQSSFFHFSPATYSVSFGTLSSQRTLNDFVTFRAFLSHN